ncbi:hypothetical protein [Staphylococcus sp. IVB6214]|uniref:hypothetical protein n=1 Tax=Staphylococcus sp. IVB6214 TaxID=2989766 RepID=UPI0021CEEBF2|nr:hypothetical protein [Staphylococcus sp. IVB6214]UXR83212.1 hypothetical protein MUA51_03940 [Staphylococcus sp. IVB6214]
MKIKVKKEMNLHELIKWAWENSIKHKEFTGSRNGIVEFDFRGWVRTDLIEPDEIFEVEVEEEITEETVLSCLVYEFYIHLTANDEVDESFSMLDQFDLNSIKPEVSE